MAFFTGHNIKSLQYSRSPYLSLFAKCLKASYSISEAISVHDPYWPPYRTDKFISRVVQSPSQWFLHLCEQIVIAWIHIGWVRWKFQNLPLPVVQEVRDSSSGEITCIVVKLGFCTTKCRRFLLSPCDCNFFAETQEHCEGPGTTQEMNLSVLQGGQYGTSTKMDAQMVYDSFYWQKLIRKEATILNVSKCCTPVNKAISEISYYYHYFWFYLYI